MPRTIRTFGEVGQDREIDELWRQLDSVKKAEKPVTASAQQIITQPGGILVQDSSGSPAIVGQGIEFNSADGAVVSSDGAFVKVTIKAGYHDNGNSGAALTIDFSTGHTQKTTLTANCTFTFSNGVAGEEYNLQLLQDGTGSRTVTWPASVKWAGGTAPTLTTTANKTDLIAFLYDGTNYFGSVIGQNY